MSQPTRYKMRVDECEVRTGNGASTYTGVLAFLQPTADEQSKKLVLPVSLPPLGGRLSLTLDKDLPWKQGQLYYVDMTPV